MQPTTAVLGSHLHAVTVRDRRATLRTLTVAKGSVLYHRGTAARHLYRVDRGLLIATLTTTTGRTRIPDLYGPGDILASAALDANTHFETVSALRDTAVQIIPPHRLATNTNLRAIVTRSLAGQFRRARRQADDDGLSVGARIARLLLRLGPRLGTPAHPGFTLPREVTHEMLADMVGASRVTVTRIVNELQAQGAVTGGRGSYTVHLPTLLDSVDHYVLPFL